MGGGPAPGSVLGLAWWLLAGDDGADEVGAADRSAPSSALATLPEEDDDWIDPARRAAGLLPGVHLKTPGLAHRGARRIVTGGPHETDHEVWYFADDHYESFCEFVPNRGQLK